MINCDELIFFADDLRNMVAIYVKCPLFEKTFYYKEDIQNAWGAIYNQEYKKQEVHMILKNNPEEYIFLVDEDVWITLKSYKTQVNDLLKTR